MTVGLPDIAWALQERDAKGADSGTKDGHLIVAPTLKSAGGQKRGWNADDGAALVAAPVTASYGKEIDNSDRNGGPPNIVIDRLKHHRFNCLTCGNWFGVNDYESNTVTCPKCGETYINKIRDILDGPDIAATLNSGGNSGGFRSEPGEHLIPIAYRTSGNCGPFDQGDKTAALNTATDPNQNIIAFDHCIQGSERTFIHRKNGNAQLQGGRPDAIAGNFGVRRLTPRECERLQGFPDDWTRYDSEGKEISDSARYRMLGNAVEVDCAEWIGRRVSLQAEDDCKTTTEEHLGPASFTDSELFT